MMTAQGYGLTETNGAVCGNSGKDYLDRPGSCGKPFPIVDWIVVDPDTGQVSLLLYIIIIIISPPTTHYCCCCSIAGRARTMQFKGIN